MAGMKISNLDFVRLLPVFMRDDEAVIALSKAVDKLLGEPGTRLSTIRTWDKIDDLTEEECDDLAWELDVDWYDSEGMDLEAKRETLKTAQQIKRKRGTKWAVERLITAYFGEGYVAEWYDLGYDPYTFIVLTTETHISDENFQKFVEAAATAKNERSHIKGIYYLWQQGPDPGIEYALGSELHKYDFEKCGTIPRNATLGFIVKNSVETEPEDFEYVYEFTDVGDHDCGVYPRPGAFGSVTKTEINVGHTDSGYLYGFIECGDEDLAECGCAIEGYAIVGTAVVGRAKVVDI